MTARPASLAAAAVMLAGCAVTAPSPPPALPTAPADAGSRPNVLATTTILADIAQNVAGDRVTVGTLLPAGGDPHSFQPTPADVRKVADSTVLIVNGAGLETWLHKVLANAGGERQVIEASAGLVPRRGRAGEPAPAAAAGGEVDPHFYLDPIAVQTYADNIARGLAAADPGGAAVYDANAQAYQAELATLDKKVRDLLAAVPSGRRWLVTDHDDLGYFADRYGLRVVGMIVPSFSSEAAPSAQQLAALVDAIRATGVKAVFTEANTNARLAQQIAAESGATLVPDLYTHSLSGPDGPAATYLELLRHDARVVAAALGSQP